MIQPSARENKLGGGSKYMIVSNRQIVFDNKPAHHNPMEVRQEIVKPDEKKSIIKRAKKTALATIMGIQD